MNSKTHAQWTEWNDYEIIITNSISELKFVYFIAYGNDRFLIFQSNQQ